ncbi:MAG: phosphomannomutase/phosphoglucomutase [Gammaproteobacteria bacterium]|nr:phosphomannomutase/phosphoglucomutase [Gammaproteobacteria bacterium]
MAGGPVSNRRFSRRKMRSLLMIGAGVIGLLVIVIGGWQLYRQASESALEAGQKEQEDFASSQASQIAMPFQEFQQKLSELAEKPQIVELFGKADTSALANASATHQGEFSSALKLRFLLPGKYELDNESSPPLSYASLDLLKRAESDSADTAAEAHLMGSPNAHIVMVAPVKNEQGEISGLIHLSLAGDLFEKVATALDAPDSFLELQQAGFGKALVLATHGDSTLKTGEATRVAVKGTRWTVAVWKKDGAMSAAGGNMMLVVVGLLVVLMSGIGLFLFFRRSKDNVAEQAETQIVYEGAVRAIMEGAHPGMEKMVPNLPVSSVSKVEAQPVSQGQLGDDITMMIKKEDLVAAAADSEMLDLTQPEPSVPADASPVSAEPAVAEQPPVEAAPVAVPAGEGSSEISAEIFRTYDIRGIVGETLNAESVSKIGQAIGSEAAARNQSSVIVGRDGRTSSPELGDALVQGLLDSGRDVIDIGVVPTPVLYYATHFLEPNSGVMLTGSHNGPEYNGLKIVLDGETLSEDGIQAIYTRVKDSIFETGSGSQQSQDIVADYIRRISEDIPVALGGAFKIVVDCGNGVAGAVAPQLIRALGHDVVELYCEVDGNFPNHHPDPSQPENMQALIDKVKEEQADIGLAFDGDGDRLGVVDEIGNIIWPDRQLMLLAKDVLSRNPGKPIIFDVKCSRYLKAIIESNGGQPLMWKTGHSLIKGKMKEVDAPLAGEMSGHIFFKERWYGFDDAIYTAARVIEVLMNAKAKPSETFATMPEGVSTPELRIDLPESSHQSFMAELEGKMNFDGAELITIDGYRVEFSDGWGLIRPSNTTPCLVLCFEAEDEASLARIQEEFRTALLSINSDLQLPF